MFCTEIWHFISYHLIEHGVCVCMRTRACVYIWLCVSVYESVFVYVSVTP